MLQALTVKNYRALLTLTHPQPRTCELIGIDLNTVKTDVTNILGGNGVRFEPAGQATPGLTLIYHPSFQAGKHWLGVITPFDVTEDMSVGTIVEQRLTQAA